MGYTEGLRHMCFRERESPETLVRAVLVLLTNDDTSGPAARAGGMASFALGSQPGAEVDEGKDGWD